MATLSAEAMKRKKEYDKKYAKEHFQGKHITFNKDIPEEIELFEWIKAQPEQGNTYIKRLIREDMQRQKAQKQDV